MKAVEQATMEQGCTSISLITTNDNLHALKFYQKRGYCLIEILRNAVEKARAYKPSIPLIGNDGIPIRDELRLQNNLTVNKSGCFCYTSGRKERESMKNTIYFSTECASGRGNLHDLSQEQSTTCYSKL